MEVVRTRTKYRPIYSGSMWDTIAFSTAITSPTIISRPATANLPKCLNIWIQKYQSIKTLFLLALVNLKILKNVLVEWAQFSLMWIKMAIFQKFYQRREFTSSCLVFEYNSIVHSWIERISCWEIRKLRLRMDPDIWVILSKPSNFSDFALLYFETTPEVQIFNIL